MPGPVLNPQPWLREALLAAAYRAQTLPVRGDRGLWRLARQALRDLRATLGRRWRGANETDRWGLDVELRELLRPAIELVARGLCRLETLGLSNIPDEGRVLFALTPSRSPALEGLLLAHTVEAGAPSSATVRPLLPPALFGWPFTAPFLTRLGCLPALPPNARQLLEADQRVAFFLPAGDTLQAPRPWLELAVATGSPIVPVACLGARAAFPELFRAEALGRMLGLPGLAITPTWPWLGPIGLLPLPSRWAMQLGAPLSTRGLDAAREADLTALGERVGLSLQDQWNTLVDRKGTR